MCLAGFSASPSFFDGRSARYAGLTGGSGDVSRWLMKAKLCLALGALTLPLQPVSAEPRAPTGKWIVHFDQNQCVAERSYGTKEKPLALIFKAPLTGEVIQLGMIREGSSTKYAEQLQGRLAFGGAAESKVSVLSFGPPKTGKRVYTINMARSEIANWASSGTLRFNALGLNEELAVSGLTSLMSVMADCVTGLQKHWNYAPDVPLSPQLKSRAEGNPAKFFRSSDYPDIALKRDSAGRVGVVVLIDESGKVADCTLVESSGIAALDGQSCGVIKDRARFKPAVGIDGKPARDVLVTRISWVLG